MKNRAAKGISEPNMVSNINTLRGRFGGSSALNRRNG
jgi:hypothetical protein